MEMKWHFLFLRTLLKSKPELLATENVVSFWFPYKLHISQMNFIEENKENDRTFDRKCVEAPLKMVEQVENGTNF